MKFAYYKISIGLLMVLIPLFLVGCKDIKTNTTTLEIIDNNRHYYPILRGQQLDIIFDIKNTGEHPFIMTDLLISCGCLVSKKSSINTIPPGAERRLILTYDSAKNIGLVEHIIDIYGNFQNGEKMELVFDTHVVPEAAYTRDYEEIYLERREKEGNFKGMTEGEENTKGYYMDEDF